MPEVPSPACDLHEVGTSYSERSAAGAVRGRGGWREEAEEPGQAAEQQTAAERGKGKGSGAGAAWQKRVTVLVRRDGAGRLAAGGLLYWSIGSARATPRRNDTNFSAFNQSHDRYERAPTRGRPSAGSWGNRWQTRRLNSLNSLKRLNSLNSGCVNIMLAGGSTMAVLAYVWTVALCVVSGYN